MSRRPGFPAHLITRIDPTERTAKNPAVTRDWMDSTLSCARVVRRRTRGGDLKWLPGLLPEHSVRGQGPVAECPYEPAMPTARILIVEDEPALLRALRINLRARHYEVTTAPAGRPGLAEAARNPPDAVILDLGLPDIDGVEVIRQLRTWSQVPVIVLTGRSGPGDKIGALDAGADDYVTKPFSMEELLARLRTALRRGQAPSASSRARIGRLDIDLAAHGARRQRRRAPDAHRVAAPGNPAAPSRAAGRVPSAPHRCGARISRTVPTTCAFTWPGCAGN